MRRAFSIAIILSVMPLFLAQTAPPTSSPAPPTAHDPRYKIGPLLYADDFHALSPDDWKVEAESPAAKVSAKSGILTLDTPKGLSVWFTHKLHGPLLITYDARAIKAGGPHDRVSDLNCFWMATDTRNPSDFFAVPRTGKFAGYNQLQCYYVGLGGNTNRTTRFRRYIGDRHERPLLDKNDLHDPADLLRPNTWQTIQLVADGPLIQYFRDGKKLFELHDDHPYTAGYFAFRTTKSHLELRNFRVYRLERTETSK